jgi:spore coat protein CotH
MNIFKWALPGHLLFVLLLLCPFLSNAQNRVGEKIFKNKFVHEIRISFSQPHYWDSLLAYYESSLDSSNLKRNSLMASVELDGDKVDSVGVRLKGYLSFSIPSDKKSIKLDFNDYNKSKRYDGLTNLGLANEYPDPSFLRSTVAYEVFRQLGVKAPRTSFAKVYINNGYHGLFVITEQVNKTFIRDNFGNDDGDLIEPISGQLQWDEGDSIAFKNKYKVKSTDRNEAYTRLIELAKKIKVTTAEKFYDSLKTEFDFNSFISVFAGDVIFNNIDGYYSGYNYYLYWDTNSKKYTCIPWDYNIAFSYDNLRKKTFSILPGGENQSIFFTPIPFKIISNDVLKEMYLDEVYRVNNTMVSKSVISLIEKLHAMISPYVLEDNKKTFTNEQFQSSLTKTTVFNNKEVEGLLYFLETRHTEISRLLDYFGYDKKKLQKK